MDQRKLFQAALGVAEPWRVVDATFTPEEGKLDLYLDFSCGARFACSEGDACPVHDTESKSWRHLDFFQHQAYLHARVPRITCPVHGTRKVSVPWAKEGSRFTLLFEALLLEFAPHTPVAAIGRMIGEHDTRLWRILEHYVETARKRLDLSEVERVGVDETSARRGRDYVSIFMDLGAGRVRGICKWAAPIGPELPHFWCRFRETKRLSNPNGLKQHPEHAGAADRSLLDRTSVA